MNVAVGRVLTAGRSARDPYLRALVQANCLEPGGVVDVEYLRGSAYLKYGRLVISSIVAAIVMVAVLPLMALVAILIKLDSPGPALFVQERTGYLGRRFKMFKFRTMVQNAESLKKQLAHSNIFGADSPDFKLADDPRTTRIGRILRRTSFDELPNLFNVVRGDMALVGPRPTSFAINTYARHHFSRLAVTPGLTGLWQISGRADVNFDERTKLDVRYINSVSFLTDLRIVFGTVGAVCRGHGAY